jgi:hypothetical protein
MVSRRCLLHSYLSCNTSYLAWCSLWVSLVTPSKYWDSIPIKLLQFLSKSCPIHHSSTIVPTDVACMCAHTHTHTHTHKLFLNIQCLCCSLQPSQGHLHKLKKNAHCAGSLDHQLFRYSNLYNDFNWLLP